MATIVKLQRKCGVRYKAIIRNGQRIIKTKVFEKKADARQWSRSIEGDRDLMDKLGSLTGAITLNRLVDEYLPRWAESHKDITNQQKYCKWWCDQLGSKKISEISPALVRVGLGSMSKTVKPATYNRKRAVLSSVLKYAVNEGYLSENPCQKVPNRPVNNKRRRYLDDDERKRLLVASDASDWDGLGLLVRMALGTGARKSELLFLKWSDLDFKRKTAALADTKNGEPRILPIPTIVWDSLKRRRKVGQNFIFESTRKPGQPMEFKKHFLLALKKADIKNFRFHDLRHSAASYLAMSGASLVEIAEILGHKSIETTRRYAHLSDHHKAELTERVLGSQF